MKTSPILLAALLTAAVPLKLTADTVYWDANDFLPGAGDFPFGSWLNSPFWSTDSGGEFGTQFWVQGDTAVFSAGTDAVNEFTVTGSGTSGSPGVIAGGIIVEEGTVVLSGGTLDLGTGSVTIKAGATFSTDSSLRISSVAGSVWLLDGGTARSTNAGVAGSFIDADATITLGPAGGTISHTVAGVLNIINPTTIVSGPGGLTKSGVGIIGFASESTYLGPTIVNDGELRVRFNHNRLPLTTDVTVNSPGILNLNGLNQQIGSLSGDGAVGIGAATLTIDGPTSTTFTGALKNIANYGASAVTTGNGRLIKNGTGVITFAGLNDLSGSVTLNAGGITVSPGGSLSGPLADINVNGGTLTLNNAAQTIENLAGTGGTIVLGAGHVLTSDPVASTTYSGTITGPGGLVRLNANATSRLLTLSGPNTYDGVTTVTKGTIGVGSATALGSTVGHTAVASGGEVRFDGAAITFTVNEVFHIAGPGATGGGAITIQNSASPTLSGPITLTGDATVTVSGPSFGLFDHPNSFTSLANQTLTLQGGGEGTITGAIALGAGGLTKLQGGKWILSGANTFTGLTSVNAGTLQLNRATADNASIPTDGVAGNTDIVIAGGTLQLTASEQIGDNGGIALNSGTFNFSGSGLTETIGSLTNSGGTFTSGVNTVIAGGPLSLTGGTSTVSTGGVVRGQHIAINGGANTVAGGFTGGLLQVDSGGAGLEMTGGALTLNSNATTGGRLLLKGNVHTLASATGSTIANGLALANPGTIDLDAGTRTFNVEDGAAATDLAISAAIINGGVVKTGAGTLTLSGVQSYTTLLVSDGAANLDSAASGAAITVGNAELNFHVNQTLTSLNIGAGGVVTLSELPPPPFVEGLVAAEAIPEPGSLSLLLLGSLWLSRRQRRDSR